MTPANVLLFPHMSKTWNLLLPLAMLSLFGFGCFQIGPRIVKAPEPQYAERPSTDQAVAVAYIRLDESQGTVTRGSTTLPAQDGVELISGDRVQVTSGTMTLVYPAKGASELSAGSDMTLLSDANGGSVFTEIRLAAGKIWTRFEHVFGNDEQFSVASQGIVATVRGTGFGVSVESDGVDVQVADHTVEVMPEPVSGASTIAPVRLTVGQGLRVHASDVIDISTAALRAKIRRLTTVERQDPGFTFGAEKLSPGQMQKPVRVLQLMNVTPTLSPTDAQHLQLLRDQSVQLKAAGFAAPTRQLLPGETAPIRIAPSMTGPTSTVR
jgi:hypothetical protein